MLDPRTPILVGGGQLNQRENPVEPVDMIVQAARLAEADAGAPGLAAQAESIRIIGMLSWRYQDPGLLVGERLAAPVRHTVYTGHGGSHAQALVNDAAEDIAAGRCDVVIVGGAEAWRTRTALRAQGEKPPWTVQAEDLQPSDSRPDVAMRDEAEVRAGLDRPVYIYPLFEQAIRIGLGRSSDVHRAEIARLWSSFSEIAEQNPAAWSQRRVSPEEIENASPTNRMISWPYTKLMVSNNNVEQAAAVIVCSVGAARRYGVPEDRWVFLRAGSEASDTGQIAARPRLNGSPAIKAAAVTAFGLAGIGVEDLGPVDLYSCFPSAVQVAAREIGFPLNDPSRPLTVTGGLTFAGGPWNNYTTHAIATMIGEVRRTQQWGLVTANSGYLTKHSIGLYAPTPGVGFRRQSGQTEADREPPTPVAAEYSGSARLESWTVAHGREGEPERVMAALRTPDGRRVLAFSEDVDLAKQLVVEDLDGATAVVDSRAAFALE
ncbi:MAG TPA: acetyl-CoA acetyltransferase [Marmoricola sp.]|nr:acetyl-CoA acetyltransferase [Marmoricola sp.]